MYRHILVPTDLSPRAAGDLAHARALVAPLGLIHLVHVLERPEVPNPMYAHCGPVTPTNEEWARRLAGASNELESVARTVAAPAGVAVRWHVLEAPQGRVVARICSAESELGIDLVCVASHGRTGLRRVLLGSVAEELARRGRAPTLVVRITDAELESA